MEFDAVVLAGGGSSGFGGVDMALLVVDGVSLLDRVLTATFGATSTVVVGPVRQTYRAVDVPAGQHRVVWRVQPASVRWGGVVSGLASLVLMAWWFVNWRLQRSHLATGGGAA